MTTRHSNRCVAAALAAVFFLCAACTHAKDAAGKSADARPVLKGKDAFGDWTTDAPGVRRLITVADLPQPGATESHNNPPKLVPRPRDAWPKAPPGFEVELVAEGLNKPRNITAAPNGDLFLAESAANRVRVIRIGEDGKVAANEVYAEGLNQPFGIAFYPPAGADGKANPTHVYIANTDSVVRFPYKPGDLKASGKPETVVSSIPAGGQLPGGGHWTRDVVFSPDGKTMFVSVGSLTNNDDDPQGKEKNRATVLRFDPDGKNFAVYATGIRNPVGLAIQPATGQLWASVNERDGLGDNLVPDYITSVKEGGFYGWPWYYLGDNPDPRHKGKRPELADEVIVPEVLIQAHSASLCMTFYAGDQFPPDYRNDAFAAEHGSWNRSRRTGYKVIRVPFDENDKPTGAYEDFLTGFVTPDGDVWGRPVGVTTGADGSLYVTDDGAGTLWRVRHEGAEAQGTK